MVPSRTLKLILSLIAATLLYGSVFAETLYKYRGADGEWIYSDRPPADGSDAEPLHFAGHPKPGGLEVTDSFTGSGLRLVADNRFYAPMQVSIEFESIEGVDYPHPDDDLRWVVPARSQLVLLDLPLISSVDPPSVQYRYDYVPGDPAVQPDSSVSYRLPYAVGAAYTISQTYPEVTTHRALDSVYAVDFVMPVGTDVLAARDGIVFDVVAHNFKNGTNAGRYAALANLVRVLHDDGTYAVYAHLNWNTIRVSPGDRVEAGAYIADSGNTGFSSGPHLHFAVQHNGGMRLESLPVHFRTTDGDTVQPTTGASLRAYP